MIEIIKIDLHMHTNISDGTDSPEEILDKVREAGLDLFSVADHDAMMACHKIRPLLRESDPIFINGIEFSCRDEQGKYHILGYGYDMEKEAICSVVEQGHLTRLEKTRLRLDVLKNDFGISFSDKDIFALFRNNNPGKPHIANLMVRYGFASSISDAFTKYLNKLHISSVYIRPEEAISAILNSGGVPVLAHPAYGSGDELYMGREMEERVIRLKDFGLQGLEAYYSGFTAKLREEMLGMAEKYGLYVTAGSDYHGTNKLVRMGNTGLADAREAPESLQSFIRLFSH